MLAIIVTVVVHYMERTFVCCSTMLGSGAGCQGTHQQSCAVCLNVSDRGVLSMRLSCYNTESMTVDHLGYRAWRVPPTLYVKHLFSRFRKNRHIVAATKGYFFCYYPNLHIFPVAVKNSCQVWPIPTSFLSGIFTLLNLFSF